MAKAKLLVNNGMHRLMNNKKYRLLFTGLIGDTDIFRKKMAQKGVKDSFVDKMLSEAPVIIKQNLTLESARKYADTLSEMGACITILDQFSNGEIKGGDRPPAPMSHFLPCPRCGLIQPEAGVCPRCGFDLTGVKNSGEGSVASNRI